MNQENTDLNCIIELRLKKILQLTSTVAPTYLVQDEDTGLFGVQQMKTGKFYIPPIYPLDEDYDLSKNYQTAGLGNDEKIYLC